MGTALSNDNESVHELEANDVAGFEVTLASKSFPSETIPGEDIGDVIALSSVTNSSDYIIESGANITWRAGTILTLASGFSAKSGSAFHAYVDECTALKLGSNEEVLSQSPEAIKAPGEVFPNPFIISSTVRLTLLQESLVSITVTDLMGKEEMVLVDAKKFSPGQHVFTIDGKSLAAGLYFVVIRLGEKTFVEKVAKVDS